MFSNVLLDIWGQFLDTHSSMGEGNGTPLQYSCLENPMNGGAWWAAVHGVAQSRTRLKRLSSSSSVGNLHYHLPWIIVQTMSRVIFHSFDASVSFSLSLCYIPSPSIFSTQKKKHS